MEVTLRIVGLFFNKKVTLENATTYTVKDVMDAYRKTNGNIANPGGLHYTEAGESLKTVFFNYNGNFDVNLSTPKIENRGKTLGGKKLISGVRSLSELRVNEDVILAWQYYVEKKEGGNKSATKEAEGFTKFGDNSPKKTYTITDGDTIIWRLVAINLTKEEQEQRKYAKEQQANA